MRFDDEPPEIAPGTMLDGHHRVDAVIGSGEFATVYRGTDVVTDREVAIKVLNPQLQKSSSEVARFERELRVVAMLRHPNTVRLLSHGVTDDGLRFIVFEHIGGVDLAELLERDGALPTEVAVHLLEQILGALEEGHSVNLLHRDLRPGNIRVFEHLSDPYTVKVLDFGIARFTQSDETDLTRTGATGARRYMPPEQVLGRDLTEASDIYSAGLLVFEMLMGRESLRGNKRWNDQLTRLRNGHFFEATGIGSERLEPIIRRMTERTPEKRFQTVPKVLKALQNKPAVESPVKEPALDDKLREPTEKPEPEEYKPRKDEEPAHGGDADSDDGETSDDKRARRRARKRRTARRDRRPDTPLPTVRKANPDPARESPIPTIVTVVVGIFLGVGLVGGLLFLAFPKEKPREVRQFPLPAVELTTGPTIIEEEVDVGVAEPPPKPKRTKPSNKTAGCDNELKPGKLAMQDGETSWTVHIPSTYDEKTANPVVMVFHEKKPSSSLIDAFATASEEGKFLVISMKYQRAFEYTGDSSDIAAAIKGTAKEACVDLKRVFAVGAADAGGFVRKLSCVANLAGIASSAPRQYKMDCGPEPPVPHIFFGELAVDPGEQMTTPIIGQALFDMRQISKGGKKESVKSAREAHAARKLATTVFKFEDAISHTNTCYALANPWPFGPCNSFDCKTDFVSCRTSKLDESAAMIWRFFSIQQPANRR